MPPSPDGSPFPEGERLPRFTRGQRWTHRALAVLMGVCVGTAALLYVDALSALVGRRELVAQVHFISGLLLPVPIVLGLALSASLRDDVRRLNRFRPADWEWLRRSDRRTARLPVGKFNAGQKLNSSFTIGAILILLATGLMLRYFGFFADSTRTGATFVHDVTALAVVVVTLGHISFAWADPEARVGLRTGSVSAAWADHEHPLWAAELARQGAASAEAPGSPEAAGSPEAPDSPEAADP